MLEPLGLMPGGFLVYPLNNWLLIQAQYQGKENEVPDNSFPRIIAVDDLLMKLADFNKTN